MSERSLKPDITTSQNLASAALSYTTSIDRKFKLEEIFLHFSSAVSETVTITLDSATGANYDIVLDKKVLVNTTDYVFRPQGELNLQRGDEIKIQCTNATATATVYATIKTQDILR